MPVRIINQAQVEALLPMADCIRLMEQAFRTLMKGGAILPLRTIVRLPDQRGIFGVMPSYLNPPDAIGLKAITVFNGNEGTRYDSHQGVVLLFEARHGSLAAIMDASSITAIRTAAASGVATQLLARRDAGDLAIVGSGVQAHTHLAAMIEARPIRRVRVWSRNRAKAEHFARTAGARFQRTIEVAADVEQAVTGADIICTVTAAREPVVRGAWIAAGAHLNVVGASQREAREVDSDAVAKARVFSDRRESLLNESGDFLIPRDEGRFDDRHCQGEIGELLVGKIVGRQNDAEITLFKSLGIAIEDLASAQFVFDRAVEQGIGLVTEIGGLREDAHG